MYRAIFLSDFHLGSRLAKADHLLNFVESNDAATWYLVGDIYDIKRLRKRDHWPASHARVIRALRAKARAGARIVYIPGNHDRDLRVRPSPRLPGIEIAREALHVTADGRRLLVVHGDEHEPTLEGKPLSYWAGCTAYLAGVGASELVGRLRRGCGLGYWSLGAFLKDRTLPRVPLVARYRANLCAAARAHGADGVVCGHIHHAAAELSDGVQYLNCGDWVDSCTAVVEDRSGTLELIRWPGALQPAPVKVAQAEPYPVPAQ